MKFVSDVLTGKDNLTYDAGRVIGRIMRRGDEASSPATQAVIVLKADGPDSFYVLTSYPEDRR